MDIHPADLKYFIEIARTSNITRAAERLGITQPSLSIAMKRLEEGVGTDLFVRSKKGVRLTKAGMQLLNHANSFLQEWEDMKAKALASVNKVQGAFVIGCHVSVALGGLPRIVPRLLKEYPDLQLSLKHDISRKITEEVVSSQIDIGIVVNPVQHPDLVIRHLYHDEFTLWRREGNLSELRDMESGKAVLICDPVLAQSSFLTSQLNKHDISFARVVTSPSLEVIADLAAAGAGIAVLPGRVAARAQKKLVRVDGMPVFQDDHCLIYRAENRNVKAIQVMNEAIKSYFK